MARGQMRGPLALACVALMVSACAAATVARPSSECIAPSLVTSGVSVNPKALQLTTSSSGIISTSTYTTVGDAAASPGSVRPCVRGAQI